MSISHFLNVQKDQVVIISAFTMPPATLPAIITPVLLSSIRGHPQLPLHSWYFIAGVTLSVINRPDEIPIVFKYAIEQGAGRCDSKPGHDEQLQIARKMREALVKAAPIGGLPKVMNDIYNSYHPVVFR